MKCHHCRAERRPTRVETGNADLIGPYRRVGNPSMGEQMETVRLVELVARRPDLADVPLLGARLAAGAVEGA